MHVRRPVRQDALSALSMTFHLATLTLTREIKMDLTKFCAADPFRSYLSKPFSHGKFTYATNGHIIVRVARREDVPEIEQQGNWNKPFEGMEDTKFSPLATVSPLPSVPQTVEDDCTACDGRGHEHECPDCSCTCEECGGTGRCAEEPRITVSLRGGTFQLKYALMMLGLPDLLV